ncbi:MAG: spore coat protein U domain-containing protein [Proteobacteria bacterium]|nr:spore coat protein U domain-containing protein [Pseudomonadota bacterium]
MRWHRRWRLALAALGLGASLPVHALFLGTCSVAATSVSFGTYDPLAATALSSTGTVTVTCTGTALLTVPVTVSLNAGLWGSLSARSAASGANRLSYNLYANSGDTQIWGDGTAGTTTVNLSVFILIIGTGSSAATVYGLIPNGQDVPPGTYGDTITATVSY